MVDVVARNNCRPVWCALHARKQASSHLHELMRKQGVSYNVAFVKVVDVKQDDILPHRIKQSVHY
jgi:uncharacterized protein YnzC (UPF0291/DUF896 family)